MELLVEIVVGFRELEQRSDNSTRNRDDRVKIPGTSPEPFP